MVGVGLGEFVYGKAQMPFISYNESGDWRPWLPMYEAQADLYETNGCPVWGSQNALEIFHKFMYAYEPNYSELYTYLLTPVNPKKGANPHNAMEAIRKYGLIEHKLFELPRKRSDFLKAKVTPAMLKKGEEWKKQYTFMHEWLWETRPANWKEILKDALKTSPVGITVTAWHEQGGLYVSNGMPNTHWCVLVHIDENGVMYCFDSYDHSLKKLHPDHSIERAKRIWLGLNTPEGLKQQLSFIQKLLNLLLMKRTLLDVCEEVLGTDASPADKARDEVGCAETVTTILRQVYPETPIILGTWTLWEYLENKEHGWKRVNDYLPGTVVLCATGMGKRGAVGHVGIVMNDGLIASNNSFGVYKGQFTKNYTPELWKKKYTGDQGMPVYLYRREV